MNIDKKWLEKNINFNDCINDSIKQIFLHIGFHKTATSSIQYTLDKSKNALMKKGIYYSQNKKGANAFSLFGLFCENPVERYDYHLQRGHTQAQVDEINQDNLLVLLKEVKKCDQDVFLLSEEHLSGLYKSTIIENIKTFLKKLAPNAKITIVCCVRNPVTYYVSDYQQHIASNMYTMSDEFNYDEHPLNDYFEYRLKGYIDIFGFENILLYTYEKACKHAYGPAGYFIENILLLNSKIVSKLKYKSVNQSRSKKMLEIVSYCNKRVPYYINGKINEHREFKDTHILSTIRGKKFDLSSQAKKEIYKNLYDDMLWLKENFDIDYLIQEYNITNDTELSEVYGKEYYDDIIRVYPLLSETIKKLVYEFVEEKAIVTKESESKEWLTKLIKKLDEIIIRNNTLVVNVQKNYKWYKNVFARNRNKGIAHTYRDMAIFCELHDEIHAAKTFMQIAMENAPNGPIINSKYHKYVSDLNKGAQRSKRLFNYEDNENTNFFEHQIKKLKKHKTKDIKVVYLHMGMDKAGSTSIQHSLNDNFSILQQNDYHYITCKRLDFNPFVTQILMDKAENEKTKQGLFDDFINDLASVNSSNLIISAESSCRLEYIKMKLLKRIIKAAAPNAEIKVIYITREKSSYHTSVLQQRYKYGLNKPLGFTDIYKPRLQNIMKVFGKKNITIYKFEDSARDDYSVVGMFLKSINVSMDVIKILSISRMNGSSSDKSIELLYYITEQNIIDRKLYFMDKQFDELRTIRGNKFKLEPSKIEDILSVSKDDTIWLKEVFEIEYPLIVEYAKKSIIYDNNYFSDITRIYPILNNTLKRLVYNFVAEKLNTVNDDNGYDTIDRIKKWIEENYNYVLDINIYK